MGENQGIPKWLSPDEMIKNSKFKTNSTENQAKKRGQKPGCHKPSPLRMNLVLEIRLLGKTILDNMPLEILLVPRLILTQYDASIGLCKIFVLYCE